MTEETGASSQQRYIGKWQNTDWTFPVCVCVCVSRVCVCALVQVHGWLLVCNKDLREEGGGRREK